MVISCIASDEQPAKTKVKECGRDLKTAVTVIRGEELRFEGIESNAEELRFDTVVRFIA